MTLTYFGNSLVTKSKGYHIYIRCRYKYHVHDTFGNRPTQYSKLRIVQLKEKIVYIYALLLQF